MSAAQRPTVVLVHGLWFGAWSLGLLARRLRRAGFTPHRFRYRTTRATLQDHAHALRRFSAAAGALPVHYVAHSMGGLVTLKLLASGDAPLAGRVVLLGSPLGGSAVARKADRVPGGGRLLGAAKASLETGHSRIAAGLRVGMIAGSRSFGLGWLVGGAGGPGDGTVAIAETRAEGFSEHLVLPVTHTGMLYSRKVAERTVRFLQTGSFGSAP